VIRFVIFSLFFALHAKAYSLEPSHNAALDYLQKMSHALQSLNYYGTLIYLHDGQAESVRIVHKTDQNGEVERVVHLSGEAREVIRNNNVVTCYLPDSRSVVVGNRHFSSHIMPKPLTDLDQYASIYTFAIAGEDRVAGKMTTVILINAKDLYRYGYKIWVDQISGLLLRSEMLDPQGMVLEQLMFADIEIVDEIPPDMLKPAIASEKFTWYKSDNNEEHTEDSKDNHDWRILKMPEGFILTDYFRQLMPNTDNPAEHMVISDGFATISVYIEHFGADSQAFVGASHVGALSIFGSILDDYHVTVVGEVPRSTVQMIAESLQHKSKVNN
jgi:sigma-E factor negative regulatory protein RseB